MPITLTDSGGRRYCLSGEEEKLLQPLLDRNIEARRQIIAALIGFDNKRLTLIASVLRGDGPQGGLHDDPLRDHWYGSLPANEQKPAAIRSINREYTDSIEELRSVFGDGLEEIISAFRAATFTPSPVPHFARRG